MTPEERNKILDKIEDNNEKFNVINIGFCQCPNCEKEKMIKDKVIFNDGTEIIQKYCEDCDCHYFEYKDEIL